MRRAFTLIELIIVIGIVSIFLSIIIVNLLKPVSTSSFATTLDVLVSDLRRQQLKAIQGDSNGTPGLNFHGIYFSSDNYVLFSGPAYQPADPGNIIVPLNPALRFSFINLTNSEIVFASGSGESANFTPPATSGDLSLVDIQSGLSKVIVINQYGVVSQIY